MSVGPARFAVRLTIPESQCPICTATNDVPTVVAELHAGINTILYLNRTGCQWDLLPHDLLPKSTVYEYFAQWRNETFPVFRNFSGGELAIIDFYLIDCIDDLAPQFFVTIRQFLIQESVKI